MNTPPSPRTKRPKNEPPLLLSLKEAGALLGISERLVWDLARDGTIIKIKLGRRALIPRSEVDRIAAGR